MANPIKLNREAYDRLKADESKLLALLPQCDSMESCNIPDAAGIRGAIQSLLADIAEIEAKFATPPPK